MGDWASPMRSSVGITHLAGGADYAGGTHGEGKKSKLEF